MRNNNVYIALNLSRDDCISALLSLAYSKPKGAMYLTGSKLVLQTKFNGNDTIKIYCTHNHVFSLPLPLVLEFKIYEDNDKTDHIVIHFKWIFPCSSLVVYLILCVISFIGVFLMGAIKIFWIFWGVCTIIWGGDLIFNYFKSQHIIKQKLANIGINI